MLYELPAIWLHADFRAHNLTWENQVLQDGVMHSHQCAAPGKCLLVFCTAFLSVLKQNSHLSNKDNALPTELLQLTYQQDLDFLERFQLRNGNKDYDTFLTTTNFNFLGGHDVQLLQLGPEVQVHLQLQEGPGDAQLKLRGLLTTGLHDPAGPGHGLGPAGVANTSVRL